jgi:hypothetical protein
MAYLFYSLCVLTLVLTTILYLTRHRIIPILESISFPSIGQHLYQQLPTSFQSDIESGLHSTNFDLSSNLLSDDSRGGLDVTAKAEISKIMKKRKLNFDEARRVYIEARFSKNGIGADGLPRDPKFVSFS